MIYMPDRPAVEVRRIYELTAEDVAAHRVLVDRLWPRGVRKDDAPWDEWLRDVAPSSELRRWYGHEPSRFGEFAARYRAELARPPASEALAQLRERARAGPVLLITATRDGQPPNLRTDFEVSVSSFTVGQVKELLTSTDASWAAWSGRPSARARETESQPVSIASGWLLGLDSVPLATSVASCCATRRAARGGGSRSELAPRAGLEPAIRYYGF